jgi:hypothetical protein
VTMPTGHIMAFGRIASVPIGSVISMSSRMVEVTRSTWLVLLCGCCMQRALDFRAFVMHGRSVYAGAFRAVFQCLAYEWP